MRFKAVSVLSTAFIFAWGSALESQVVYNSTSGPSRFSFGGDVVISQPKGEFASNVPNGYGFDMTGMFRIDPKGWFNIRADLGGVQYGRETKKDSVQPDYRTHRSRTGDRQSDRIRRDRDAASDTGRLAPSIRERRHCHHGF